jgi:DNA-binding response OmpR family regulator
MSRRSSTVLLIVEDNAAAVTALVRKVTEAGDVACCVSSISAGREAILAGRADVVVMDWSLPDGRGASLCVELRVSGVETPVLLLTPATRTDARVEGLRSGADDCVAKPWHAEEVLLRVQALTRRTQSMRPPVLV